MWVSSSRCAACKHLRRKCPSDCIFSPYFPSNNPERFEYVHKIYGASNVGKILQDLPADCRAEAANSLYYEAYCRIKDPVYGCVGMITILQRQIYNAQCQLARIQAEIAALNAQCQVARIQGEVAAISIQSENNNQQYQHQVESGFLHDPSGGSNTVHDISTWFDWNTLEKLS